MTARPTGVAGEGEAAERDDWRTAKVADGQPWTLVCGDYANEGEPDGWIEVYSTDLDGNDTTARTARRILAMLAPAAAPVPAVPAEDEAERPVISTERVRPDSRRKSDSAGWTRIAELERRLDSLGRTYNEQAAKLRRAQEWGQQQESRAIKAERVARHAALAVSPPAPDTETGDDRC